MIGTPSIILESLSVAIPLFILCVALVTYVRKRQKVLLGVSFLICLFLVITTVRLATGVRDHLFLRGLKTGDITEIIIGKSRLAQPDCVEKTVRALNEVDWFSPNHEGYSKEEPLVIRAKDGDQREFRITELKKRRGAVIHFTHECGRGTCYAGDRFSAGLPDILRSCGVWGSKDSHPH